MIYRLIAMYAIVFGTCLQMCIREYDRHPTSTIVVYKRGTELHAVLRLPSPASAPVYYDPAFRRTRAKLDGSYRFTIQNPEHWRAHK